MVSWLSFEHLLIRLDVECRKTEFEVMWFAVVAFGCCILAVSAKVFLVRYLCICIWSFKSSLYSAWLTTQGHLACVLTYLSQILPWFATSIEFTLLRSDVDKSAMMRRWP